MKSITLKEWLQKATPAQRAQLYKDADTSYMSVHQMAVGHRNISPAKAGEIEKATIGINQADPSLPPVLRLTSCAVCAECPFAKQCNGGDQLMVNIGFISMPDLPEAKQEAADARLAALDVEQCEKIRQLL
ncbi:hypothetical protein [Noviherbaspirillum pedocola]|uniref:Uncharacterized protein n=1 Tax=Noviherbaspirillum pedocola TaxID=2801341 RepID=A0A934T0X0_9BURK|nr:hypothetical protein [Noviherbaspirillum pedocola]MBK4736802.1 hypothetical protein [Noviherbaspirillum pedocola]